MAQSEPVSKNIHWHHGKLTDEDVYKMMMLHKYQRKTCAQLARQFGISRAQAYDIIARRQIGGCCG